MFYMFNFGNIEDIISFLHPEIHNNRCFFFKETFLLSHTTHIEKFTKV